MRCILQWLRRRGCLSNRIFYRKAPQDALFSHGPPEGRCFQAAERRRMQAPAVALRGFPWHERVDGRTGSGRVEGTPAKAVGRAWWGHPPCIDPQRLPFPRVERCRCIRERLDDRGRGWGRCARTVLGHKPRISAVSAPVPRNSRKNQDHDLFSNPAELILGSYEHPNQRVYAITVVHAG